MRKLYAVIAILSACGCQVDADYLALSSLMPTSESEFRFMSAFDAIYPHNDPAAEAGRQWALEKRLETAGLCPGGYRIVDRTVVVESHSAFGAPMGYIRYLGVCI